MKKLNAFLLILLSIVMIVSCPDNGADKPKTFSITYKSNIDGVNDITETYTIGDENLFPFLSFSGVTGKYIVGYAETKTRADHNSKEYVDYNIEDAINFNTDKSIYAVWNDGTVYTLSLNGRGATLKPFDNFYYTVSSEGTGEWYTNISLDPSKKMRVGETYDRPQYNKTLKFVSNMDGVANPSDQIRKWNVYYSENPTINDYSYYFSKISDQTKAEDSFDITKSIDKNTEVYISWVEQQQPGGEIDHTYDLPLVSKEGKWFAGWKKPNNALFEKLDSNGDETLTLTGSWMDEVTKPMGTEEASEEMINTIAKISYVWTSIIDSQHTQTIWSEDPPAGQFIVDLYSMESPYKTFKVSNDSRFYLNYFESNINNKGQSITYLQFNGKIDDKKYEMEFKISYDETDHIEAYDFIIVNGISYACNTETFKSDLNSALQAIAKAESRN